MWTAMWTADTRGAPRATQEGRKVVSPLDFRQYRAGDSYAHLRMLSLRPNLKSQSRGLGPRRPTDAP